MITHNYSAPDVLKGDFFPCAHKIVWTHFASYHTTGYFINSIGYVIIYTLK